MAANDLAGLVATNSVFRCSVRLDPASHSCIRTPAFKGEISAELTVSALFHSIASPREPGSHTDAIR